MPEAIVAEDASRLSQWLVRYLANAVRVGYQPTYSPLPQMQWFSGSLDDALMARTSLILPTYVTRCSGTAHAEMIRSVAQQFQGETIHASIRDTYLVLALQHDPAELDGARERAREILDSLGAAATGRLGIVLLDVHGKVPALNAVLQLLKAHEYRGLVGWVDDDIELLPECLSKMACHLDRHPNVLLAGASKLPMANRQRAARIFHRIKLITKATGRPHPHGCAILGRMEVLGDGIPRRYVGEDGYLALLLFDETAANPFCNMAVVADAKCRHVVGGPLPQIYMRVRRTLYENAILLADFPHKKSARFVDLCIFHGLVRPEGAATASWKNKILQSLLLLGYIKVGATMLWKGWRGKPIRRVRWSAYEVYARPN